MLVVSDTSPLTALLQIDRATLLATVFGRVLAPPAVSAELLRFHDALPEYLEIHPIRDREAAATLGRNLDRGESEAIILAEESHADYLLMDDKPGRLVAESRGLRVIGLLGVLVIAKKAGLIDSVGKTIEELEIRARFFVSDAVKRIILRAAGEDS
jgi:uncharacterized protein